jgi:hypothetical protein
MIAVMLRADKLIGFISLSPYPRINLPTFSYLWQLIAGSMHHLFYMIHIYKFAEMLPANFYIPD